jgi:hypothetical protein
MRVPGAVELLTGFEKLTPEVRGSLLNLVRTLSAQPITLAQAREMVAA